MGGSREFDLSEVDAGGPLEEEFSSLRVDLNRALWAGTWLTGGYAWFSRTSNNDPVGDDRVGTFAPGLLQLL